MASDSALPSQQHDPSSSSSSSTPPAPLPPTDTQTSPAAAAPPTPPLDPPATPSQPPLAPPPSPAPEQSPSQTPAAADPAVTVSDSPAPDPQPDDGAAPQQPEDRDLPAPEAEEIIEESYYIRDLKAWQKKSLLQLKAKIQAAIADNSFLDAPKPVKAKAEDPKVEDPTKEEDKKEKDEEDNKTEGKIEEEVHGQEQPPPATAATTEEPLPTTEEPLATDAQTTDEVPVSTRDVPIEPTLVKEQEVHDAPIAPPAEEGPSLDDLALWGIPLLHSKGNEKTDVLLLKFLRARDFKVDKALSMLQDTMVWRKEFNADGLVEEEAPTDFHDSFIHGVDREGHPVCYNRELSTKKGVDDEAQLKRRIQVLEKGIQGLDFSPNGIHKMVQVIDFAGHSPAFLGRGLKLKILDLLQDNYPELVSKQIFINLPWYFPPLLSLFNPTTRSKAVLAKPGRAAETLFKYISPEQVPVQYGGLSRPNDVEFAGIEAPVTQVIVKAGEKQSIELPVENAGRVVWDISVIGWDVLYNEEFVPNDGYVKIIRKGGKVAANEEPLRNMFVTDEQGKMVLTIDNTASRRRRVVVYRYTVHAS